MDREVGVHQARPVPGGGVLQVELDGLERGLVLCRRRLPRLLRVRVQRRRCGRQLSARQVPDAAVAGGDLCLPAIGCCIDARCVCVRACTRCRPHNSHTLTLLISVRCYRFCEGLPHVFTNAGTERDGGGGEGAKEREKERETHTHAHAHTAADKIATVCVCALTYARVVMSVRLCTVYRTVREWREKRPVYVHARVCVHVHTSCVHLLHARRFRLWKHCMCT